jgi:hypothetical protein
MIKQVIDVNGYWKVIVYYNINYNLFSYVYSDLYEIKISKTSIKRIYNTMITNKAKAVTISNINLYTSIVCFNKHKNKYDYINSIVHEAEHVKQAMLEAYNVADYGEPPAYTIGYLVMKMLMFFKLLK